ncbi:MAG: histone deacetylase [Peptococcaceae bacterium]
MNSKTGLVFFPAFDWAISPTHPEREERLLYTRDQIIEEGILDFPDILEYKAKLAAKSDIQRVHFCLPSYENIISEAHLIAAGSAMALGDAWHNKEIKNGFALVRPPGHHAMHITYGNRGFCNINNEAILIEYLRKKYGYRKIAVIDTDVHHGDGTQDIFYHDPDVLFISLHQDGRTLFPGTGFTDELGGPNAYGMTINLPLLPGSGDQSILLIMKELILPILRDFSPEIIINSAGQDNHFTDPLANMNVTAQGYAQLTDLLQPDILVLEGGYAVETALPYVNLAIILALAEKDFTHVIEPRKYLRRGEESSQVLEYTKALIENTGNIWTKRYDVDREKIFDQGPYSIRHKQIFYDTDFFTEEQQETVKKCDSCGGYLKNITYLKAGRNKVKSLCISVPLYSCLHCQNEGEALFYSQLNNPDFTRVFLQHKPRNLYLGKDDLNGKN